MIVKPRTPLNRHKDMQKRIHAPLIRACATALFCDHYAMSTESVFEPLPLLVACLCAQWCGTCRDYLPLFTQLQAEFPQVRFTWVDVEDESELVDPVEVENFPTLLMARGRSPLFFGPVMPHLETLKRLIQNHVQGEARLAPQSDDVVQLAARLSAR